MREVSITGDTIRLGQFLKLADLVDAGAGVKDLLASGSVQVNDVLDVDGVLLRVGRA